MPKSVRQYFQEELRYLREAGAQFALEHPDLAHWLGHPGSDPSVDRLLEGTAFLTAGIQQKLDEELPLLAQSLCSIVAPNLLLPCPSVALLEFAPGAAGMRQPVKIPAGTEVASVKVEGTSCTFRTLNPVVVEPLILDRVRLEHGAGPIATEGSRLTLGFRTCAGISIAQLRLKKLRLHLLASWERACDLYAGFVRSLGAVRVCWQGRKGTAVHCLPPRSVSPIGLDRNEAPLMSMCPGEGGRDPFRWLGEYDLLGRKFLAVDIDLQTLPAGFGEATKDIAAADSAQDFEIEFLFRQTLAADETLNTSQFGLFCTPIANLFACGSEPIRVRHERAFYVVRPAYGSRDQSNGHLVAHSIERVTSQRVGSGERFEYVPLSTFSNFAPSTRNGQGTRTYTVRRRLAHGLAGSGESLGRQAPHLEISFSTPEALAEVSDSLPFGKTLPAEVVTVDLLCTNGQLPRHLGVGDICCPTDTTPPLVSFANVTAPTPQVDPPLGESTYWRLLSQLHLHHADWASLDALKELLRLRSTLSRVDTQALALHESRLRAIETWQSSHHDHLVSGLPLRCTNFEAVIDPIPFGGDGGVVLFGTLLHQTLCEQAPLNTTCCLTFHSRRDGKCWPFLPPQGGDSRCVR